MASSSGWLRITVVNVLLLCVTLGAAAVVVMQNPNWVGEEIIFGMIVIPLITFAIALVVAVIARGLYMLPMFGLLLPFVCLSLILSLILTPVAATYLHADKIEQKEKKRQAQQAELARLTMDAPGLPDSFFYDALPAGYELRNVQVLPDDTFGYWVRMSTERDPQEKNFVAQFRGDTFKLTPLRSLDDLWAEVKQQQHLTNETYVNSEAEWDLPHSQILFYVKGTTDMYRAHLKADKQHVYVDHSSK